MDLIVSCYMLFQPSELVTQIMQLTFLSNEFALWLLVLAIGAFFFSWLAESMLFPKLARALKRMYTTLRPRHQKQRRKYKVLLEEIRKQA